MEKRSLGLIETWGFTPAVVAADTGMKAANVALVGCSLTSPALITVIFSGDVAAVRTAVSAAKSAAARVGRVVTAHVIARPGNGLHSTFVQKCRPAAPKLRTGDKVKDKPRPAASQAKPASVSTTKTPEALTPQQTKVSHPSEAQPSSACKEPSEKAKPDDTPQQRPEAVEPSRKKTAAAATAKQKTIEQAKTDQKTKRTPAHKSKAAKPKEASKK